MRSAERRAPRGRRRPPAGWGSVVLAATTACIIPDRDIRAESDDENAGAVRIVESIAIVQEWLDTCRLSLRDEQSDPTGCPQVPTSLSQGLIPGGPYCQCPGLDGNPLAEFSIYAEDPDRRGDRPADILYAVALLDLDPLTDAPQNYVAYPEHFAPGGAGEYTSRLGLRADGTPLQASIGREDNGLWRFRFGKDGGAGVDLCNDNNGNDIPLGLHNLQIMVTDRPFFRPARLDADGNPLTDDNDRPQLLPTQFGMPDLAVGATWAVANYVFECHDPAVNPDCQCEEGV